MAFFRFESREPSHTSQRHRRAAQEAPLEWVGAIHSSLQKAKALSCSSDLRPTSPRQNGDLRSPETASNRKA